MAAGTSSHGSDDGTVLLLLRRLCCWQKSTSRQHSMSCAHFLHRYDTACLPELFAAHNVKIRQ